MATKVEGERITLKSWSLHLTCTVQDANLFPKEGADKVFFLSGDTNFIDFLLTSTIAQTEIKTIACYLFFIEFTI